MATIIGEQTPRACGVCGPFLWTGNLAASTATSIVLQGSATYVHLIPMLSPGLVLAMSGYRNPGYTAGAITVQLGVVPAGSAAGTALQPVSGASYSAATAGGAAFVSLLASPYAFAAGDALGIILTAASAGTALLTCNLLMGA